MALLEISAAESAQQTSVSFPRASEISSLSRHGRNHLVRAITLASPLSCMVDREVRSDKIAENISDKKDKISFYLTSDILMRAIANCPFRGGEDRDVRRTQRPKARMPLGCPNDIFSRLPMR